MNAAPVDVVGRAMSLLRAIANHEPTGASTSELARTVGLARPTAHRLLTSMQNDGMVDREPTGQWLLGPELYLLGNAAAGRYDVSSLAQPVVRRLAVETEESAFFSARRGDETVCLVREDGSFPIRSHVLHEGLRLPLGVASAGIAILAFMPDAEVDQYLAEQDLTSSFGDAHSAEAVRQRVFETRRTGYGLNPGLLVEGSWGIGAAVFDAAGSPRWALSLTGIERRFRPDRCRELGSVLLRAAHQTSMTIQRHTAGSR
jgi:DNA-binding IclR family transcriptional regulator